jgi:hypothetical protein
MAVGNEVESLNEIHYKSKVHFIFMFPLFLFMVGLGFVNFYPIGDTVKNQIQTHLSAIGCKASFDEIDIEWFMPKIIISDLSIPPSCLNRQGGEALEFSHVTLNYLFINFSPFGLPFRLDTEFAKQPIEAHYVLGFSEQMLRVKDQVLNLTKLEPLLGNTFKLGGTLKLDLTMILKKDLIKNLNFKAGSDNLIIPSQNIQGFTLPNLKINKFFSEAYSENYPKIIIEKLIIGDPDSPLRADFKGNIEVQQGNAAFSPLNLKGEVAFSESFKQSFPLIEMVLQRFPQNDDFYQINLGGTLGNPQPVTP